jgi:hypothetical protein
LWKGLSVVFAICTFGASLGEGRVAIRFGGVERVIGALNGVRSCGGVERGLRLKYNKLRYMG